MKGFKVKGWRTETSAAVPVSRFTGPGFMFKVSDFMLAENMKPGTVTIRSLRLGSRDGPLTHQTLSSSLKRATIHE